MHEDAELLRRYAESRSEEAFAELVWRHLNLVYFAALRRTGDAHLAEDIAQRVFTTLACEAASLAGHATLTGWLYTTTRFTAAKAVRDEQRRQTREQEAFTMQQLSAAETTEADWAKLRPVLDAALDELNDREREAVLLRCLEGRAFAEIGGTLQLTEDAARMRVDRALDKLQALLAKRGVTSTAGALALVLANQAAATAPAGLAASVTGAALANALAAGTTASAATVTAAKFFSFMSITKLTLGVAGIIALAATAIAIRQQQTTAQLRTEITALRQQQASTVASLRAENERLAAGKKSEDDTALAEHTELVQLRAARDAYRAQVAQARKTSAAAATNSAASGGSGNGGLAQGMVSMELMQNVGNATPTATAQSIAWGLQHADLKRVAELLEFEPADRAKLEAFIATLPEETRAKYGTPEQVVALMMAGSPRPISGVQLLSRSQPDASTEVQTVQWQYQNGEVVQNEIKFHRDGDSWKQVMSSSTVDRVIAYFQGKK